MNDRNESLPDAHPPPFLPAVAARHRRHGAAGLLDERLFAAARRRGHGSDPLAPGRRTSRRRPRASSTCTWPARPRSSTSSTQAQAPAATTASPSPRSSSRASASPSSRATPKLLGSPVHVRAVRPVRRPRSPTCCRTLRRIADDIAIMRSLQHRPVQPRPRPDLPEHRPPSWAGPAWARGSPTGSAARSRTCPASSSCSPASTSPTAASPAGAAASCPRSTRACSSARRATRSCTSPTRRAWHRDDRARARSTRCASSTQLHRSDIGDPEIDTRIAAYELAFRMQTSVPEVIGPLAGAARPSSAMYGAEPGEALASPTTACSRAGWSSAACASCSSTTGAGTTTAPARATTSSTACPKQCREIDQAARRPGQGPQAARPARRDAGRLGRRVRPHAR